MPTTPHPAPTAAPPPEPDPGGASARPAKPCRTCGTTGGFVPTGSHRPRRSRGQCDRCYLHGDPDDEPINLPALIFSIERSMNRHEIAARRAAAAAKADACDRICERTGHRWRERHPEQFTPENLAAIFPHAGGLAVAVWHEADTAAPRAAA